MESLPDPERLRRDAERGIAAAQYNLGAWLLSGGADGQPDPAGARRWLEAAAEQEFAPALLVLARLRLAGEGGAPDPAAAVPLLDRAAAAGHPEAMCRLADLRAMGEGTDRDAEAARAGWAGALEAGFGPAAGRLAWALEAGVGGAADPGASSRVWRDAAAAGDATALAVLGSRLARGHTFPVDPRRALACFQRAAAAGHPSATLEAASLAAEAGIEPPGAEAPAPDPLQGLPEPDANRALPRGGPTARLLSWSPRAFVFAGLIPDEERLHLIAAAAPLLRPALVVSRETGRPASSPGRRSGLARLGGPFRDPIVAAHEERIALHSRFPPDCGETLVVLCYGPGDEYRPHQDWFDPADPARREVLARGGQRLATFITWLSPVAGGGETIFPAAGLTVPAEPGGALFFYNCHPDGTPDPASGHAGAPVTRGGKWIATRWLRERAPR